MDLKLAIMLTPYGGITVMLPAALVITGWLWLSRSRRSALLWMATLFVVYSLVVASKILFKGWGVAMESIGIYVLSGHAMNTCLVLTGGLSLLARQVHAGLRWPAALLGLTLGWVFSVYCVAPYIHPLPEAVAGALLGSLAACVFLLGLEKLMKETAQAGVLSAQEREQNSRKLYMAMTRAGQRLILISTAHLPEGIAGLFLNAQQP